MKIGEILRKIADAADAEDAQQDATTPVNTVATPDAGTPDPQLKNPAKLIGIKQQVVPRVHNVDIAQAPPAGKTPSGNDKEPDELYLPPLQQKQELLKKAVGVQNIYDDGRPAYSDEGDPPDDKADPHNFKVFVDHEDEESAADDKITVDQGTVDPQQLNPEEEDILAKIKRMAGVPTIALAELDTEEVFDN